MPLKFKAPSKKRRTFAAPVVLRRIDAAEGRFGGLLAAAGATKLH